MEIYNIERSTGKTELLIKKCIDSNFEYPIIVTNNCRKKEVICRISSITHKIPPKDVVFTVHEWFIGVNRGKNISKILIDDIDIMLPIIIKRAFGVDADTITMSMAMNSNMILPK